MDFEEILNIAGFTDHEILLGGDNWKIWKSKINIPYIQHESLFIFFNSRANLSSIEDARKELMRSGTSVNELIVVIQNSAKLPLERSRWKNYFPQINDVYTVRKFLLKRFEDNKSVASSSGYGPSYFVEPDIKEVAHDSRKKAVQAILGWLIDPDRPSIAVLIGRPGGGKTTLAKHLFQTKDILSKMLPFLIRSEQWQKFDPSVLISLDDIWKEAATLCNIDQRKFAIQAYIKNGVLFPIFDGFDELCSLRSNQFNPNEIIEKLLELTITEKEGGKILLTSRDVFWKEIIFEEKFKKQFEVFELQPFNNQQLALYLEKRFSDPKTGKRKKANELIQEYQKIAYAPMDSYPPTGERLGNVPVVVEMIANYVEQGGDKYCIEGNDPIYAILKMLCHREQIRQQIETEEDRQIDIFKEIAVSIGEKFSEKDLEGCACLYSEEFNDPSKVLALHSHPFVKESNGQLSFRYGFLPMYFQALYTFDRLKKPASCGAETVRILEKYSNGADVYFDYLAEIVLRHFTLNKIFDYSKAKIFLHQCIEELKKNRGWCNEISSSIIHLALRLIDKSKKDFEKAERTKELLSFFEMRNFKKLRFKGMFNKLDFADINFEDCIFADVGFVNCAFGENTNFKGCNFQGGIRFSNCLGVGNLRIDEEINTIGPKTRDFLVDVINSIKVTKEQLLRWIVLFLKRFKSGVYFVKLGHDQLFTGINVQKLSQEAFLKLFIANKILEIERGSAGSDILYRINSDFQIRAEVESFLENGIQGVRIKKVYEELEKSLK